MHPLELATRTIDSGEITEPTNRVTNELTELADGLALVESFSHSAVLATGEGLVVFDASSAMTGAAVVDSIRTWSDAPISSLVYTHGHADHVGGSFAIAADAAARAHDRPTVIAHRRLDARLDRYRLTNDWSLLINQRQFGGIPSDLGLTLTRPFGQTSPSTCHTASPTATRPSNSITLAQRPTTIYGPGFPRRSGCSQATSSSGTIRTLGILRRCSATPPSGPQRSGRWSPKVQSS
jgi:Metallo-beta-lactamase superfamily